MAFLAALAHLREKENIRIVHQTGAADRDQVARAYAEAGIDAEVKAFFHDMASRYRRADLVVCRAGATTVAELTAMGKAALCSFRILTPPTTIRSSTHGLWLMRAPRRWCLKGIFPAMNWPGVWIGWSKTPAMLADMAARSKTLGRPGGGRFYRG